MNSAKNIERNSGLLSKENVIKEVKKIESELKNLFE